MVYAHSSSDNGAGEPLCDHLQNVARLCAEYCLHANLDENEGYAVGLCHDVGKSGHLFQEVLQGRETKIDHESPGAYWILKELGASAYDAALAIHAHHKGLVSDLKGEFFKRILIDKQPGYGGRRYACTTAIVDEYCALHNVSPQPISRRDRYPDTIAAMLRVRVLLSALCDADYTATSAYYESNGGKYIFPEPIAGQFDTAFGFLSEYREKLMLKSTADERINSLRRDLYEAALLAAKWDNGSFSLTAPTGSGKTLAMLGFALRHAMEHGKRRIIFVFPYLTLIEQAAREIRKALAPLSREKGYIFEDHSRARDGEVGFMIPDWSEPIIITTTIKFFESLFANKPTHVRHLHNIANSVVLFDEAQSLPFGYAQQTVETLSELCDMYGVSVLFSTATQPAFDILTANWSPREIVPPELHLFERAQRVTVHWPPLDAPETSWDELARELSAQSQSLTVVNTRTQALKLIAAINEHSPDTPVFHLSTNMCISHREDTLDLVRSLLCDTRPCLLVSTQCIEAGVDISFPAVYRALGPLDSVIQAFGRCNRDGKQALGDAHVFLPPLADRHYPDSAYTLAANEFLRILGRDGGIDIDDPLQIRIALEALVGSMQNEVVKGKFKAFADALMARDYAAIDEHYTWIDTKGINVLVPYKPKLEIYNKLVETSHGKHLNRNWLSAAQSVGVNISLPKDALLRSYLKPIVRHYNGEALETGWFYPVRDDAYDSTVGLRTDFSDNANDFIL